MKLKDADKVSVWMNTNTLAEIISEIDHHYQRGTNWVKTTYDILKGFEKKTWAKAADLDSHKQDASNSNTNSSNTGANLVSKKIDNNWNVSITINNSDHSVSSDTSGNITSFWNSAPAMAKHIISNSISKSQFEDMKIALNPTNKAISELDKYFFEKDGKIVFVQDWKAPDTTYTKKSLNDFLK